MSLLAASSSSYSSTAAALVVAAAASSASASASASLPRRQLYNTVLTAALPSSSANRCFTTSVTSQARIRRSRGNNPFEDAEWEPFQHDDVPTLGHDMLNRQRELLNYARIVEHELPNLEKLRQPYKPAPPSSSVLQFRSVHHQGIPHKANAKSVLTVNIRDLYSHEVFASIEDEATRVRTLRKFLHLAGPRWNPGSGPLAEPFRLDGKYGDQVAVRGEVKISSERFPTERQNMKWCSDVLDEMIREAKNLDDGIADLPIDIRHAVSRENKKAHHGRRRKATIADWPSAWATPRQKAPGTQSELQSGGQKQKQKQ